MKKQRKTWRRQGRRQLIKNLEGKVKYAAVMQPPSTFHLQRSPEREYCTRRVTLRFICGNESCLELPRTVDVRHGDSHFDEVGVCWIVCSSVAQLGGERLSADSPHLTRLTHTFG